MRYIILKPERPVDPRRLGAKSQLEIEHHMPPLVECASEKEAQIYARRMFPDAHAMPMAFPLGSGTTFLLGFVEDGSKQVDPDAMIPFVLCIQPKPESDHERARLKRGEAPFDSKVWKLLPVCPTLYKHQDVELRATDLAVPAYIQARVGSHNGRSIVYVEVGGIEMSLMFRDPKVQIGESFEIVVDDIRGEFIEVPHGLAFAAAAVTHAKHCHPTVPTPDRPDGGCICGAWKGQTDPLPSAG